MSISNPLDQERRLRHCPHCKKPLLISNYDASIKALSAEVNEQIKERKETIERLHGELVELGAILSEVADKEKGVQS